VNKNWAPTEDTFRQFLNWLDEGVESSGEKYLELRRRLVLYFDRKNCLAPDELADETLGRVAQKLAEKGAITNLSPAHYCYVTAKYVFLEYLRRDEQGHASFEELVESGKLRPAAPAAPGEDDEASEQEQLLRYVEQCLAKLGVADRDVILEYHRGEGRIKIETRRQIAERLGVSANALSIRACRIREKVEACVRASAGNG